MVEIRSIRGKSISTQRGMSRLRGGKVSIQVRRGRPYLLDGLSAEAHAYLTSDQAARLLYQLAADFGPAIFGR